MSFDMDNSDGKASLKQQKSINQYDVQVWAVAVPGQREKNSIWFYS